MVFQPNAWKIRFAALCALGLILLGCKSGGVNVSQKINTIALSGKVTYTRIPEIKDDQGRPIGLETDPAKFVSSPARWVALRLHTATQETDLNGNKVWVWAKPLTSFTDTSGNYGFDITPGTYGFIELVGGAGHADTTNSTRVVESMYLVAGDSAGLGIESAIPAVDRPVYVLRKPFDGSSPANPFVPGSTITAASTVDFNIGLSDKWMISTLPSSTPESAHWEATGTGSRVLAILDTAYKAAFAFLSADPGHTLLLHYAPGISHPKGSFIAYDPEAYPLAYNPAGSRYTFGSIRGGSDNDDAWDEGVLLPLFCRNRLWAQLPTRLLPVEAHRPDEAGFLTDVQELSPDLAFVQGAPEAMAASILGSPYLADHAAGTVKTIRDVRDWRSLGSGPTSAPALASACWDLILKANSLPNPGTPADWVKIDSVFMNRFFTYVTQLETDGYSPKDINNFYTQVVRLQEAKSVSETIDLAGIFTDTVLNGILQPYGMAWPRPTTGTTATFLNDWGKDPVSFNQSLSFSMANATTDRSGVFPNNGAREVFYAKMVLTKDVTWSISLSPAPPAGAEVELLVGNKEPYRFTPTPGNPFRVTLAGNATTPIYAPFRVRLVSPGTRQADGTYTLQFTKLSTLVSE